MRHGPKGHGAFEEKRRRTALVPVAREPELKPLNPVRSVGYVSRVEGQVDRQRAELCAVLVRLGPRRLDQHEVAARDKGTQLCSRGAVVQGAVHKP